MPRIKNTDKYNYDSNITIDDYLIGSDYENNGQTKNFKVGDLISFIETEIGADIEGIIQNNKAKVIDFGFSASPFDGDPPLGDTVNNLITPVEILETEFPVFEGLVSIGRQVATFNKYLVKTGKGTYGQGGDVILTDDDFILIETSLVTDFPPVSNNPNANVVDLGEIPDGDFVPIINAAAPAYVITAGTNWYFEFTVGGQRVLYGFDGVNGTYGNGQLQMTINDLFLVYDERDDIGKIPTNTSELVNDGEDGVNPFITAQDLVNPTGLESLDEGNGVGWRLIGRIPTEFANIGEDAVDFTTNNFGGTETIGATGTRSFTANMNATASGDNSAAFNIATLASGLHSFAINQNGEASGQSSFTGGVQNTSSGYGSVSFGQATVASGSLSTTFGVNNTALAQHEFVIGRNSENYTLTNTDADRIFAIGNGINSSNRSNALTVIKTGEILANSLTTSMIDAELTGKILTTKEWVLANTGVNLEGYLESGTRLGGDLLVTVGDYDNSSGGNKLVIDDINEISTIGNLTTGATLLEVDNGNGVIRLTNNQYTAFKENTGQEARLATNLLTATRSIEFPDQSGTIALLSDISGGTPSGLETVTDTNTGWRLIGRTGADYADIGDGAIDFSVSNNSFYGATGLNAFAIGNNNRGIGDHSFVQGFNSEAIGFASVAFSNAFSQGNQSFAAGRNVFARSLAETSLGAYDFAPATTGDTVNWVLTDRIFNVGIGLNNGARENAFTILKNGEIGVGIDDLGASSTGEKVQINGKVKASDLKLTGLPVYADDTAAGTGGLTIGDVYQTSTGELRIKL